jgi:uncharacterized protein (DUF4415 family)
MRKKPLTNKKGDVRKLGPTDFKGLRSLKEDRPDIVAAFKQGRGRPSIKFPKRQLTMRLSSKVVDGIKASGPGYNARIERILQEALDKGRL